jgi:hypothetical protein
MAKSPSKNVTPYGWPTETILPDENDSEFVSFADELMVELAPRNQYARSLATDIVCAIWDIQRHRRLLGSAVRGEFKRQAVDVLTRGVPRAKLATAELIDTANDFSRDLLAKVPEALEVLARHGMTVSELTAAAYEARASTVAYHETRIADLERRRAKLMSDFDRLQQVARPRDIEDAVEVD